QASYHWKQLAESLAMQVKTKLKNQALCRLADLQSGNLENFGHETAPAGNEGTASTQKSLDTIQDLFGIGIKPVYVQTSDQSVFGKTFHTLLVTELINHGLSISSNKESDVKIKWKVQEVKHQAKRTNQMGLIEGVVEGVVALVLGGTEWGSQPHEEIIITCLAKKNDSVLVRRSDIYYINNEDRQHYWAGADLGIPVSYTVVNK
ncbi:MAG: hypothetical protein JRI28_05135, partial [Deltaproteobacteria bacterium]|nr:hypothetical protein [Deltaproteobacteria bacterium]